MIDSKEKEKEEVLKVAIVGMGIGRPNGMALDSNPRGRVVALCDLYQERMEDFAAELEGEVKFYTDYKEMCADPEIDAVFVGTPNQEHAPVALKAVESGKHVLVTKPLADSVESAEKLVEEAEKSGVVNMMSLSTRFSPKCQYLKEMAEEGEFGELYYARARSVRRSGIPDWNLGFLQRGGGALRDMGVHALDGAWSILGRPEPLSALASSGAKFGPRGRGYFSAQGKDYEKRTAEKGRTFHPREEKLYKHFQADDYTGGFIRFENGIGMQVESFWASHQPEEFQIELFGTEAGARLDPLEIYRTHRNAPQDLEVNLPEGPSAWEEIADRFIRCVLDGEENEAPLRQGLGVQKMLEALLESGQRGEEVEVA